QARQAFVIHDDLMPYAALPAKPQQGPAVADELDVPVAQRRKSEAVLAGIFRIADARSGAVQHADDDSKHFLSRQATAGEVAPQALAEFRQRAAEINHAIEFG